MQSLYIFVLVLNGILAQRHLSSSTASISFLNDNGHNKPTIDANIKNRNRHMYALCPPNFQRVGTECYYFSEQHSSWLEAHFYCKEKNAKLAEPQKYSDRKLRTYLQKKHTALRSPMGPIWIGATYDWQSNVWQWGISGRNLTYEAFIQNNERIKNTLENHCAVYDPELRFRWSVRSCPNKYHFLCQHKMPKVSAKNRYKVYERWNATYPNQYANEVILEVIERRGRNGQRSNQRVRPVDSTEDIVMVNKPPNRNRKRPIQYQDATNAFMNHHRPAQYTKTEKPSEISYTNVENERKRTQHDRKLQRQREKEQRRLLRKRERQQRMRQDKLQRLREQRQRKHHYTTPQSINSEDHKNDQITANPSQKEIEKKNNLLDEGVRKQREERFEARNEADSRGAMTVEPIYENIDEQFEISRSQMELEKYMIEEQERIRLQNEQNRQRFELEEKQRQEEIARKLKEEEKLLELQRLEEAKELERKELARLMEENRIREENQRRREQEIARLQEEQRKAEEEEQKIRRELEEAERHRQREHEEIIKREEEQLRAKEELEKRQQEEQNQIRLQRLNALQQQENEKIERIQEQKRRMYAERLAKLSPEDQKRFFELRKLRKSQKLRQNE